MVIAVQRRRECGRLRPTAHSDSANGNRANKGPTAELTGLLIPIS
jgi:hypothetical protein